MPAKKKIFTKIEKLNESRVKFSKKHIEKPAIITTIAVGITTDTGPLLNSLTGSSGRFCHKSHEDDAGIIYDLNFTVFDLRWIIQSCMDCYPNSHRLFKRFLHSLFVAFGVHILIHSHLSTEFRTRIIRILEDTEAKPL
jgi:nanoRNase/pAp phosphatase (c-di-AMP/oligoRNAs hydrolase)